jgi:hypothetical protein
MTKPKLTEEADKLLTEIQATAEEALKSEDDELMQKIFDDILAIRENSVINLHPLTHVYFPLHLKDAGSRNIPPEEICKLLTNKFYAVLYQESENIITFRSYYKRWMGLVVGKLFQPE